MLRKRLVGVVTVRGGWAVQSFGYRRWLPLGRPHVLVENLDRWGADEIILQCIDRAGAGPDLALLERVSRDGLSTPLIYAGGIRTAAHAVAAVKSGADRVCVDALLHEAPADVARIAAPLGAQAVIATLPLSMSDDTLMWLDHRSGAERPLSGAVLDVLRDGAVSEALVVDWRHEGSAGAFDPRLLDAFPVPSIPLIAFGGLSSAQQLHEVLLRPRVAAAAVGNFLNYGEHAIRRLKAPLADLPLRPATTS